MATQECVSGWEKESNDQIIMPVMFDCKQTKSILLILRFIAILLNTHLQSIWGFLYFVNALHVMKAPVLKR